MRNLVCILSGIHYMIDAHHFALTKNAPALGLYGAMALVSLFAATLGEKP